MFAGEYKNLKKYINSISALQFYQLVRYSTLILIGIVFTKTTLSQAEIGEYETFLFIAGAISFFWLNGLLKALLPVSAQKKSGSNIFSAFVLIQFFSILAALFLLVLQNQFSGLLLKNKEISFINLVFIFVIISVPANLVEYYYLLQKKNKQIILYGILSFGIQFILVVLPAILGLGIEKSLHGLVLASGLKYVWLWILFVKNREIHVSTKFIGEHVKVGGPLVVATFLSGSAQFVDGFIVTSKFDEGTFAVFRYGARELPLATVLANALSNALLPDFANPANLSKTLLKLKASVTRLLNFLFPVTVVLLLLSYPLFPVVFNPEFAKSATVFNVYLLLVISRILLPQTILNGLKLGTPIMIASFFEVIINVVLSLFLVRFWGIAGIAFATFLAYLFEKIFLVFVVHFKLKISLHQYIPVKKYLLFSSLIIIVFLAVEWVF